MTVQHISAVTLAVKDMAPAVDFYQAKVGLELRYGGPASSFTSFKVGEGYLNTLSAAGAADATKTAGLSVAARCRPPRSACRPGRCAASAPHEKRPWPRYPSRKHGQG